MNALDLLKQYEKNALLGADLRPGSDFFNLVVDFLGSDETARNTRQYAKAQAEMADRWVPANQGYETPLTYRTGRRLLYVFNFFQGKHAYLDLNRDVILTDEEAQVALGN